MNEKHKEWAVRDVKAAGRTFCLFVSISFENLELHLCGIIFILWYFFKHLQLILTIPW